MIDLKIQKIFDKQFNSYESAKKNLSIYTLYRYFKNNILYSSIIFSDNFTIIFMNKVSSNTDFLNFYSDDFQILEQEAKNGKSPYLCFSNHNSYRVNNR